MKLIKHSDGTFDVEVEGATVQEVWQQAAFWDNLPTICPVDQKPVRFGYKKDKDGNQYFYLWSTGTPIYEFHFGTSREDKQLFPGKVDEDGKTYQRWTRWDGQQKVTEWENGRLVNKQEQPPPQTNGHVELSEDQKTKIELERIGQALYGNGWPETKKHNVDRITNNRPDSLTVEDMNKLIAGMKTLQKNRQGVR